MRRFKADIFKLFNEIATPTPNCPCDTCTVNENCYIITINSTASTSDIGVRYLSDLNGNQEKPLTTLMFKDNLNGTFSYFVCSINMPVIYEISSGNSISWPEGSFSTYTCPDSNFYTAGISLGELSQANGCDQLANNLVFINLINNAVILTSGVIIYNTNDISSPFIGEVGKTYTLLANDPLWPDVVSKWAVEVSPLGVISIVNICP